MINYVHRWVPFLIDSVIFMCVRTLERNRVLILNLAAVLSALLIDRHLVVFLSFLVFQSIPSNNPLAFPAPLSLSRVFSLSRCVAFLPTRDKSAPCCDSIARLFRINLTAGINQCDSSSVIPKESPDIYTLKDPSIRGRHMGFPLSWTSLVHVCAHAPPLCKTMRHRVFCNEL